MEKTPRWFPLINSWVALERALVNRRFAQAVGQGLPWRSADIMVSTEGVVLFRSIKTFIKDPESTDKFEEVVPGLNLVEGIVRVDEPLRSPVRGQNCAAFFYRSFLVITGGRAPAFHKLRELEVYTSFALEMEGGVLDIIPSKPGKFSASDHLELSRRYGKEFQGVEEVVLPGARVRIRGKAKKQGGKLLLRLKDISVLDKQAVAAGMVGDRKKRRKRKKG